MNDDFDNAQADKAILKLRIIEPVWYVVAPDGTEIEGPFYFREVASMMLASHPRCRVEKRA
jgi:hypothetical protein